MLPAALMAMAMAADAPSDQGAAGSATPSTLDVFKTLCMAGGGDFSKAISQADAMGWRAPGPRALGDLPKSLVDMKDGELRATLTPDGAVYLVFTGRDVAAGADGKPGRNRVCGVMGVKVGAPDADFGKDVRAWAGTAPMRVSGQQVVFVAEESAQTKHSASENQKLFDAGKLKAVFALSPPDANILVYLVPTQAN